MAGMAINTQALQGNRKFILSISHSINNVLNAKSRNLWIRLLAFKNNLFFTDYYQIAVSLRLISGSIFQSGNSCRDR